MNIEITKEQFDRCVVAAANATCDVFDSLTDYFERADEKLYPQLFLEGGVPDDLQNSYRACVVLTAFAEAIPDLDLVLTNTGFGVVSNQNVVPASRERVQALLSQVKTRANDAFEFILAQAVITLDEDWWEHFSPMYYTSLFTQSSHLKESFGISGPHLEDLIAKRPAISMAETEICRLISQEQFDDLVHDCARNPIGINNVKKWVVSLLRNAIMILATEAVPTATFNTLMDRVFIIMEKELNKDLFQPYLNSQAYKARHFEYYQNEKEDKTYFFG